MKPHYFCDVIIERKLQIETTFPLPKRQSNKERSVINGLWSFGCCILIYDFFFQWNVCAEVCVAGHV